MLNNLKKMMLVLSAAVFCTILSCPGFADTWKWTAQDNQWYCYRYPDGAAADYVPEKTTGWVQDADGAWYYLEESRMVTGWVSDYGRFYYLGTDGRMLANQWVGNFYVGETGAVLTDTAAPDGTRLSANGSRYKGTGLAVPAEALNEKTARYLEILKEHPDARAEFTAPESGNPQMTYETTNGFRWICYKLLKLYDAKSHELLYEGDGAFLPQATLERNVDGTIEKIRPTQLFSDMYISGSRVYTDPAGFIYYLKA